MSDDAPAKLDEYFCGCLYFSLSKFQRNINKLAEEAFQPAGIAPGQAFILLALHEKKELNASGIADMMGLAPSTVTRFLDKLERMGFCIRRREGRQAFITISKAGVSLLPQIHECWKALFHAYNELYGAAAAEQLNKMIVKLNHQTDKGANS